MSRVIAALALLIAVVSLVLNIVLIVRLEQGRRAAVQALDLTTQRMEGLTDATISQTVRINRSFTISGTMPINQNFMFPVSMTVPFSSTIDVKANTPLGPMSMPINVNTSVPVKMQVPVSFNQSIPYSMTVPIDMAVPFEIRLRDLGIDSMIQDTKAELQRFRNLLQ